MLLVASYVFYGWWDARFLSLLVLSTVVDFFCSHGIHASSDPARRLRLLRVSIAVNLGVLGFFKYFDFFTSSSVELLNALGLHASLPLLEVILPVGISFYTFQTMAYTIDVYRGQVAPARRFLDFALYVGFFPQLVAGPIERARALLPQLENPRRVDASDWTAAIQLLLLGYFKKVCIADGVAPYVDRAFADPAALSASSC
jgi:D-alanyl-lipoteichoic acid acyltransferase DltB (MBOAT superfamily)